MCAVWWYVALFLEGGRVRMTTGSSWRLTVQHRWADDSSILHSTLYKTKASRADYLYHANLASLATPAISEKMAIHAQQVNLSSLVSVVRPASLQRSSNQVSDAKGKGVLQRAAIGVTNVDWDQRDLVDGDVQKERMSANLPEFSRHTDLLLDMPSECTVV
jgi:hypothetical protein